MNDFEGFLVLAVFLLPLIHGFEIKKNQLYSVENVLSSASLWIIIEDNGQIFLH
jgi:hypothetical protein